jgi:endonuclease/exonuclease/phosphatase (EEP) superfamily protein YafD
MSPALAAPACFGLAALLPQDQVWPAAVAALFLASPRWILALWAPLGLLLGLRVRPLLPAGLVLGSLGLLLSGAPLADEPGEGWFIVSANVNTYGEDPEPHALERALGALRADVVLTVERRAEQIPGMLRVADDYGDLMPRPSHGSAVFCREAFPCEAAVTPQIGSDSMKMPVVLTRIDARLCLLGLHAPPPAPYDATGVVPYMAAVASHVEGGRMSGDWGPCRAGDPVIASGDLNAVPWGRAWSTLRARGLETPLLRHGIWATTWPAGGGWPNAPFFALDHVFVGEARACGCVGCRAPITWRSCFTPCRGVRLLLGGGRA